MGVSKAQKVRVVVTCACGCGGAFEAFPVYRSKSEGGGLRVPEYKRGHSPNCRKTQTGSIPAWNAGLSKADHPSISKIGFQPEHPAYNNWDKINERFKTDPSFKDKWLAAKRGQIAWNVGLDKSSYVNGVASGAEHGNWKGGVRGTVDTAAWQTLRRAMLKRDSYTCQVCGDKNRQGRGSRINLEVHHIESLSEAPHLALDPANLITLCRSCHYKTHNYGSKGHKRGGN